VDLDLFMHNLSLEASGLSNFAGWREGGRGRLLSTHAGTYLEEICLGVGGHGCACNTDDDGWEGIEA
jgi:hypothetical protein